MKQSKCGSCESRPGDRSRWEAIGWAAVLICGELASASTASCVKSLPDQTPSVLRGLWRQTLTSIMFSLLTVMIGLRDWWRDEDMKYKSASPNDDDLVPPPKKTRAGRGEKTIASSHMTLVALGAAGPADEETALLPKKITTEPEENTAARLFLVALTVLGATLQNDAIVVALRYASSAAVMCLVNTTPIWLILYALINCRAETPGMISVLGASLSLLGAVICSTAGGEDGAAPEENEGLGAIIAVAGAIGGAVYMSSCSKLRRGGREGERRREADVGSMHPVHLSLVINVGMMAVTFFLCLLTMPRGIVLFSTDLEMGFFGFVNMEANPAALLHSIVPGLGGLGIMLSLKRFEPLIVSMVVLTEPLNASVIAMYAIQEPPPGRRTIMGVSVVLVGCAVVLRERSKALMVGPGPRGRLDTKETYDTLETASETAD